MEPLFQDAIQEHLELKRRNARLEWTMPLDRYRFVDVDVDVDADVDKHSLFKSEAEARLEETLGVADGNDGWPTAQDDRGGYPPDQFWLPTTAFNWGD
jgi:hypothetical protein